MKISELIPKYLSYLKTIGRSAFTIRSTKYGLRLFVRFMENEKVLHIEDITFEAMFAYQEELAFRVSARGGLLAIRAQEKLLSLAKGFTRYAHDQEYLITDPGAKIKLPKQPKGLPKVIMTLPEIKKLLDAADMHTNGGYRNRIIIEILYDTAIRRLEVCNIKISDLDLDTGYVHIRGGKGNKDRVVPVSKRVCELINNYILSVRPSYVKDKDDGYLILNRHGQKMDPMAVWQIVRRCVHLAGIKRNVSPHTFRHTCATHMLKNGAPVRHLQEMLGHESLESTQIYTRVTINDLKDIHARYHPSESMRKEADG
jgi:integrase/recombinase XerD